ncbi:MAG: PAS domain-containing protein, partial [Pseudomonadota bacterium]
MRDEDKSKEQLINELEELRQQAVELQKREVERKRAEAFLSLSRSRLHHLLISSPAVIYSCKPTGEYPATFVSENIKAQLGYDPKEFLDDPKFWAAHIHPEDRPRVFAELSQLFEKGFHKHKYRFRHRDGTYRWMRDELRLVRDPEGNPVEIVGYWVDVTEEKQTQEKLKRAYEDLRETQEKLVVQEKLTMLGQLAGGVAHELRNPLGDIKNAVYFLNMVMGEQEPEVKQALEILEGEVATSEKIISSLLDFALWKPPIRRQMDINKILQESLSRVTLPENIEVVSDVDESLPPIQ